jgi:hypothetical protein
MGMGGTGNHPGPGRARASHGLRLKLMTGRLAETLTMKRELLYLGVVLLWACNPSPDAANAAASDAGADTAPPCPSSPAEDNSPCTSSGQACMYPAPDASSPAFQLGCYCVAPEMIWLCCDSVPFCGPDPEHPRFTLGAPCCPGSTQAGTGYVGGWCEPNDTEILYNCAVDDPHWRETTATCNYPQDAGTDADAEGD